MGQYLGGRTLSTSLHGRQEAGAMNSDEENMHIGK